MNAFKFSLEKVHRLRQEEETAKAKGVATAHSDVAGARRAQEDLEAIRDAGRARITTAHGSGSAVGHLQNLEYVLGRLDEQVDDARSERAAAEEQLGQSIEDYREALQRRKTLDNLRERRLELWRQHQKRLEQAVNDEVAILRHGRNALVGGAKG